MSYWTVQPGRFSFETTKLREWVESHFHGEVLNACCGPTKLDYDRIHRNDKHQSLSVTIDGSRKRIPIDADTYFDVRELAEKLDKRFEVIIYDPPFSKQQANQTYGLESTADYSTDITAVFDELLKPGGKVLQLGFSSTMFASHPSFETVEVNLFNTLGRMDDWITTVSEKRPESAGANVSENSLQAEVVPNVHASGTGSETTSGNGGSPITMEYHPLPSSSDLEVAVRDYLATLVTPATLHLDGRNLDIDLPEASTRVGLTADVPADFQFDARTVSDSFADRVFYTVLFTPYRELFQENIDIDGRSRGKDAVLKREFLPLLAPHGTAIQVGRTATWIPGNFGFERDQIAIFAHPERSHDVIVTVDSAPGALSPNGLSSRWASGVYESAADTPSACLHCGLGKYHSPVYEICCLACGAAPGNYCVSERGEILQSPHQQRLDDLPNSHGPGECIPDQSESLRATLTETGQGGVQTGLSSF